MATDITELRQLQDRLASLGLLMGSTAHGIKGMLTALDGSVYRLGSGIDKGDEARTRDSLKDMRQLVARLRKMVLDILYFAKERKLDWNILVAEEFMRSVVSTVSDKAAEAGIAMTLEADGDPGTFEADASALSAALVNLLENAVDACRADGSKKEHYVRVSVKGLPDAVEVRIEDNGIGMTEETRTKLFTLFFSSKGKGGTGIGLYVAARWSCSTAAGSRWLPSRAKAVPSPSPCRAFWRSNPCSQTDAPASPDRLKPYWRIP